METNTEFIDGIIRSIRLGNDRKTGRTVSVAMDCWQNGPLWECKRRVRFDLHYLLQSSADGGLDQFNRFVGEHAIAEYVSEKYFNKGTTLLIGKQLESPFKPYE